VTSRVVSHLSAAPDWPGPDEALVADARGALRPSAVVDARVAALLRSAPPPPLGEAGRARESRNALRGREVI
jgi:hypothetical protein